MRRRGHEDVASKDVYLNGFLTVAAALVLVLQLINPPTQSDAPPPGHMVITIDWPEGNTDVDGIVKDPLEPRGVMYSNKTGKNWSLVRDDTGTSSDPTPMNRESYISRAAPAGHYVFNLHLYRGAGPIEVWVEVRLFENGKSKVIAVTRAALHRHGQEITVIAFDLDDKGKASGMNNVFQPLRSADK